MTDNYRSTLQYVRETIECEGFDYAFNDYSDFKEVQNDEFHRLRLAFLRSRKELEDFMDGRYQHVNGEYIYQHDGD